MNNLMTFVQSKYIYIPFLLWFNIQLFKLIYDLVTTKKFNFKRIIGAGGMPSSHSAVVVGLATLIGKNEGVGSPIFVDDIYKMFFIDRVAATRMINSKSNGRGAISELLICNY